MEDKREEVLKLGLGEVVGNSHMGIMHLFFLRGGIYPLGGRGERGGNLKSNPWFFTGKKRAVAG